MSGAEAEAALLTRDADGNNLDGGSIGGEPMNFSVVGTASGATTIDQANFFFRDPPAVISSAYALATVTPIVSSFTAAEVASFVAETGPYRVVSWNFTAASAATVLSTMRIIPRRITPFGEDSQKAINVSTYLDANQYQTDRINAPVAVTIDGYTGVMVTNTSTGSAATYSLATLIASRMDKRLDVAASPPVVMKGT